MDTNAIRAYPGCPACWATISALCDELDKARAETHLYREAAKADLERLIRWGSTIARVREYVDHPGNWSALDGRRTLLLRLLDGDAQ